MIADGDVIFEGEESYLIHSSTEDQKKSYNDILKDIDDFSISKGANGIIELKLSRNEKQMIEVSGTMVKISK